MLLSIHLRVERSAGPFTNRFKRESRPREIAEAKCLVDSMPKKNSEHSSGLFDIEKLIFMRKLEGLIRKFEY